MGAPVTWSCGFDYLTGGTPPDGHPGSGRPEEKIWRRVSVRARRVRHPGRSAAKAAPSQEETMTNTQPASPATSSRTRLGWVLGLTSTAYCRVVRDSSVVLPALPRMQLDLHAGLASLQWTVNAYGIAFAAGIITAAALGDRFGRRRGFNIGLSLFTVASAACALAPSASDL